MSLFFAPLKPAKTMIFLMFLLLFMHFFSPNLCSAQSVGGEDFTTGLLKGSPLALGGAYRALANDNNALLFNPAGIGQNKTLSISVDWLTSDYLKTDNLSVAAVDGRSDESWAFGLGYDRISQEIVGNDIDYQQVTLGIAGSATQDILIGVAGKYYESSIQNPLFDGPDGVTADIGILYKVFKQLSIAAALQNIVEGTKNPNIPLLLSGAIAYKPDDRSSISMDIVEDFSTPNSKKTNFYWGGQFALSNDFLIRTGYGLDQVRDDSFLGTGLLVTAPRAFLGFTYARHFDPAADTFAAYLEIRI